MEFAISRIQSASGVGGAVEPVTTFSCEGGAAAGENTRWRLADPWIETASRSGGGWVVEVSGHADPSSTASPVIGFLQLGLETYYPGASIPPANDWQRRRFFVDTDGQTHLTVFDQSNASVSSPLAMVHRTFDGTALPGMGLSLWHIVGLPGGAAGHALDINIVWDSFTPIGTRIDWYTYKGGVVGLNFQWRADGSFFASGGIATGGPTTLTAPLTIQSINDGNVALQVESVSSQIPFSVLGNGNSFWIGANSTSGTTEVNSPNFRLTSTYWNGAASVQERFVIQNIRIGSAAAGNYILSFTDQSGTVPLALAGSGGQVGIGMTFPSAATLSQGQLAVRPLLSTTPGIIVRMAATPTAIGYGLQDSAGGALWSITQTGDTEYRRKDSTTEGVLVGSVVGGFNSNTHASYTGRVIFNAADFAGTREAFRIEGDGTAARIGFLGANAVVRPGSTDDLRQALINLGLYTTGGATPLDLNGGVLTAANIATFGQTLVTPPASSSFTQVNVTTATMADVGQVRFLNAPSIGASHAQLWVKALAGGAYTWIVNLEPLLVQATFTAAGLALRDSVGGKIITFEQSVITSPNIAVVTWSDANTRIANSFLAAPGKQFPWLKIHDDGAVTRTYSVSHDGVNWIDVFSEGRTSWLGVAPNQAGVFACANGAAVGLGVYSYAGV